MAHQESDREDLFEQATTFSAFRIELSVPGRAEPVFLGFREDGGAGVYFSQEHVYHLTPDGRLRRAYLAGALYKAERGWLVRLIRERTPDATILRRTELDADAAAARLEDLRAELAMLMVQIVRGDVRAIRSTDDSTAALSRVAGWIDETLPRLAVAQSPRA